MLPAVARWRVRQDRVNDPRDLLVPAYSRFTKGFTTADLRSARKKLEALCHSTARSWPACGTAGAFPPSSFHEWVLPIRSEGISETR
jgi:hypothetical protein